MGKGHFVTFDFDWFLLRPCVLFPQWPLQRALHPHKQLCCFMSREFWPESWRPVPEGGAPIGKGPFLISLPLAQGLGSLRPKVGKRKVSFYVSFPHVDFAFELILCFYSFVYTQFFGMRKVLGTDDSMSVIYSGSVSWWHRFPFYKMVFLVQLSLTFGRKDVNDSMW